ncbi:MAG TPA: hypothetical protein VJU59_01860 [Paraburkholderia sp.]|uniref:hypothetical protein n=1 Tax=Paraburkholderia sp. TaxID=1926495 RepID=UPI002B471AE7|nr:hypothetical protein [Paraburkholderia sp.]HKR38417.1 hypothetical protein [Paraburkholderia sp.]
MTQAFGKAAREPVMRAERELAMRLEAMSKDGGLQLPITPGPLFVLLALATGEADFVVLPDSRACEAAAQELRRARPGGYVISERTGRTFPPRTFGSDYPDNSVPRYAYVHVSEQGMMEIVSGELADKAHGLVVGLGLIEQSIRERDAEAMRAAFEALEVDGPIVVTAALLRTRDAKVSSPGAVSDCVGVLHVPYVTIEPRCFSARVELHAEHLNQLVSDLWTEVGRQVSST